MMGAELSPGDQADNAPEASPSAKTLVEKVAEYAAVILIVIGVCVGLGWFVLHEILDVIDATTGLVASFGLGGLVGFVLAWALLLDHLGVSDFYNEVLRPRSDRR